MKANDGSPRTDHAIGDFDAAVAARRRKVLELPMSERLARMHLLSKQLSAIKGVARKTQDRADLENLPDE